VIGAYRDQRADQAFDSDATFLDLVNIIPGNRLSSDQRSVEVRLASNNERSFSWIVGAYLFNEEASYDPAQVFAGPDATGLPFPIFVADFSTFNETDSYAVFGEIGYDLTKRLTATLGLRYSDETKKFSREDRLDSSGTGNAKASWDDVTPKFVLNYEANDDLFLYVSVTKGFKSGGWTFGSFNADPADPEKVWSYEAGVKSQLFANRVRANVAGFYYDYSDLQKRVLIVPGVTGVVNAAQAEVWGLEVELEAVVSDNFSLFGSVGYLDATYDSYSEPVFDGTGALIGTNDFSGQRLDRAPKWQINVSSEYRISLGAAGALILWRVQSREYFLLFPIQ
jgi:iron complex outermembrane receptor protein